MPKKPLDPTDAMYERGTDKSPYARAMIPHLPSTTDEEIIVRMYLEEGACIGDIAKKTGVTPMKVKSIVNAARLKRKSEAIKETITKSIFEKKAPVLEAIIDGGLVCLLEWMREFANSGKHKNLSVEEAQKFTALVERVSGMWRLDLGKSTQNVAVLVQDARRDISQVLADLQKPASEGGDPFKDYAPKPQQAALPVPPEKFIIDLPMTETVSVGRDPKST